MTYKTESIAEECFDVGDEIYFMHENEVKLQKITLIEIRIGEAVKDINTFSGYEIYYTTTEGLRYHAYDCHYCIDDLINDLKKQAEKANVKEGEG